MKVEIFTFCEAATVADGRLFILGAFDKFIAAKGSGTLSFTIALRTRFSRNEGGEHVRTIVLANADGKNVIEPITRKFTVSFEEHEDILQTAITFDIARIESAPLAVGDYEASFFIDQNLMGSIPLYVRHQ